jgi:hypothetical protein
VELQAKVDELQKKLDESNRIYMIVVQALQWAVRQGFKVSPYRCVVCGADKYPERGKYYINITGWGTHHLTCPITELLEPAIFYARQKQLEEEKKERDEEERKRNEERAIKNG